MRGYFASVGELGFPLPHELVYVSTLAWTLTLSQPNFLKKMQFSYDFKFALILMKKWFSTKKVDFPEN